MCITNDQCCDAQGHYEMTAGNKVTLAKKTFMLEVLCPLY